MVLVIRLLDDEDEVSSLLVRNPVLKGYVPAWKLIKLLGSQSILEIGCRHGEFLKFLKELGYKVVGIDVAPEDDVCIRGRYEDVEFNRIFDLVVARLVFSLRYSYNKNIRWHLEGIAEKLSREARYVVLIDDRGTVFPKHLLSRYFDILVYEALFITEEWYNTVTVLRSKTALLRQEK